MATPLLLSYPPAISTRPLVSSVAVCWVRTFFILESSVQVPLPGSYISELDTSRHITGETADHQHLSVGQQGGRRIIPAGLHQSGIRPGSMPLIVKFRGVVARSSGRTSTKPLVSSVAVRPTKRGLRPRSSGAPGSDSRIIKFTGAIAGITADHEHLPVVQQGGGVLLTGILHGALLQSTDPWPDHRVRRSQVLH